MGRTAARRSRDPARKHQKYHESGPARPATGGAQNGGDFVVVKRKMARTGRRALGSARRSQANSSPARCVRALRLNSMPRLHSLHREASSTPRAQLFGAMVLAQRFAGCHPSPWSLHNDSQACPHAPQGSGHASCFLKRASSPLDRELAQRTVFQQTLSDGRESPTHSPTPD